MSTRNLLFPMGKMIAVALMLRLGSGLRGADVPAAPAAPATSPSGPACAAILEPEVLGDMPTDQRKALAGQIDMLLTESLSKSQGFILVDRQALEKVLDEYKTDAAKVTVDQLAQGLRPFWSAGVLICTRVDAKTKVLVVDAVSAQSGQLVASLCASKKTAATATEVVAAAAPRLAEFALEITRGVARIQNKPLLEISGKLTGSLNRLAWMVDDLSETAGARVAASGSVEYLVPRQPLVTKEERLLRVMGLSEARKGDPAGGLSPVPQIRLNFELIDSAKTGVTFEKTPITLKLTLQNGSDKPLETTLDGTAGQWDACRDHAVQWAIAKLPGMSGATTAPTGDDAERAGQLAKEELAVARQMVVDAGNRYDWYSYGTEPAVLAQIARRALRAAHLDPTNEEAARYVALTCDALYPSPNDNAANTTGFDRVIIECQRYLDRFRHEPKPYNPTFQVMEKCGSAGRIASYPLYPKGPTRYAEQPNDELYRYTKVYVDNTIPLYCAWVEVQGTDNIWAVCKTLRYEVFSNCPDDKLEQEHDRWQQFWRTTVDKIKSERGTPPPFQYVEMGYYVRKKDHESVRRLYRELAAKFPKLDNLAWTTRVPCTEALWKEQLTLTLHAAGDPQWQTWEPSFSQPAGEVFYPKLDQWDELLFRLNPAVPSLWASSGTFVGSALTFPQAVLESGGRNGADHARISALCIAGEDMVFIAGNSSDPAIPHTLYAAPMSRLTGKEATLAVEPVRIEWPPDPAREGERPPAIQVQTSLVTHDDQGITLWIGTTSHGIARFTMQNGKWSGRWFTDREGLPTKTVSLMTTCIHEGRPCILAFGSGNIMGDQGQGLNKLLWVMDEATGASVLLGDSRKIPVISDRMMLRWPTGQAAPLTLYHREWLGNLDLKNATFAPPPEPWCEFVSGCDPKQPWGTDRERIAPVDVKTFALQGGPLKGGLGATPYYDEQTYFIAMLPTRAMRWVDMPGPAPIYPIDFAAMSGQWLWLGMNGTRISGENPTLTPYRPAPSDKDWMDHDLWIPPVRMPGGGHIRGILNDGTRLWVTTTNDTICRIDCAALVEAAANSTFSTAQWRQQFEDRLAKANWRNQVQYLLSQQKYDEAICMTVAQMAKANRPDQLKEWTDAALWQAVALARAPGQQNKAVGLYAQLSDNHRLEPTARAFAMINLIKVSHVAGQWQRVLDTADKLFRMFPELKDEQTDHLPWYLSDARKHLAASSQSAPPPTSPAIMPAPPTKELP